MLIKKLKKMEKLIVDEKELTLVKENALSGKQMGHLLKKTPAKYVKERPAKGGGKWKYVTGGYVKKCLNLMFGWDWDFEIVHQEVVFKQVIVKGRLTCRTNGKTIVKMQYGNKDIMYKKGTEDTLDIGNEFKAAATDCLKKCSAEIGIAADIYNPEEFREIQVGDKSDSKPELLPNTYAWAQAVNALKEGKTIDDIEKQYLLSEENRAALLSQAI